MKIKNIIEFIEMCIGAIVIAFGISLMIKSNLGQTAYTALANNLSKIMGFKAGTFIIIFNVCSVFGQMILLRKDFKSFQLLQILVAYLNGQMVNIFCYEFPLTASISTNNYMIQGVLLLCGILGISFGVAIMRNVDSLKMPLEEFAFVLSQKICRPLPYVRQAIDIISIIGCVITIFLFELDYSSIREGTWCSMFLLGRSMTYTFPIMKHTLENINGKLFKLQSLT
jgi:Predicted membrane protein